MWLIQKKSLIYNETYVAIHKEDVVTETQLKSYKMVCPHEKMLNKTLIENNEISESFLDLEEMSCWFPF